MYSTVASCIAQNNSSIYRDRTCEFPNKNKLFPNKNKLTREKIQATRKISHARAREYRVNGSKTSRKTHASHTCKGFKYFAS